MGLVDDHLAFMLQHQVGLTGRGVVVWRGTTLNATLDQEERLVADGSGGMRSRLVQLLRIQTSLIPTGAVRDDTLTIDGVSYRARSIEPIGDGLVTEVLVANA